ncbi:hypothetical protein WUBG_17743, partial [Wuchereria bancrofti]
PLATTCYGNRLRPPVAVTTYNHLLRQPLTTTCCNHLLSPPTVTTCPVTICYCSRFVQQVVASGYSSR